MNPCDECRKIAQELRDAWLDNWLSADQGLKEAWLGLIGGNEEDAERAEEVFPRSSVKSPERVRRAIVMKFQHEAQTGHKIPLRGAIRP